MYIHRIMEKSMRAYLDTFKAIALVGPKFCGKTTLAEQYTNSTIILNPLILHRTILGLAYCQKTC
ncbi:MAG: hypothetical protein SCM11_20830, partial [Bacillota bacterium]|nr:hypothetical protein [Bacillota bacterium]